MSVRGLWGGDMRVQCEKLKFSVMGEFGEQNIEHALAVPKLDLPNQSLSCTIAELVRNQVEVEIKLYKNAMPTVLVGQDNWRLISSLESYAIDGSGLVVTRTLLGWALHGYLEDGLKESCSLHAHVTCCAIDADNTDGSEKSAQWDELIRQYFVLENLGVSEMIAKRVKVDRALKILQESTRKVGREWETGLLWKEDFLPELNTRATALKRLRSLEKKQDRDSNFALKYYLEMERLFEKGYAVKVTKEMKRSRVRYISHFGVENRNKPDRIRLVFDAAEKTDGISLNDLLDTGPDLLESLLGVLTRFRQYPFAVKADIKDMFLRIKVIQEDRGVQRFFYRGANRTREPEEYEMTCLIFGSKSSPCSALYVKNTNAKRFAQVKPEASRSVIRNSYMDDYLASGNDPEQMQRLVSEVSLINGEANLFMHGWASNHRGILASVSEETRLKDDETANLCDADERVLGLYWDRKSDTLSFNVGLEKIPIKLVTGAAKPSKRELVSIVMSVFDPLGILTPFTLNAKLIIQDIWHSGVGWDSQIRDEEHEKWSIWLKNLEEIKTCMIPRSFIPVGATYSNTQLHVFCDASSKAFSAVTYLRITSHDGTVHLALIMAKSRVAPLKPVTIPRLELQAALLGTRVATTIAQELDIPVQERIFWSDSTTVLHWIRSDPRTKQIFVANRLGEIGLSTKAVEWRWVPTKLNVADDATRTSSRPMRTGDRWFVGPDFLRDHPNSWPIARKINEAEQREIMNLESRKEFIGASQMHNSESWEVPVGVRILGWQRLIKSGERARKCFYRWYQITQEKRRLPMCSTIEAKEMETAVQKAEKAESFWFRVIQSAYFAGELEALRNRRCIAKGSKLISLQPFIDTNGLLRARGRVARGLDKEKKISEIELKKFENQPIILDAKHYATKLLIEYYHKRYRHANNETVINEMRQQFYIVGLRTRLRWLAKRCLICRLHRAKPDNPPMADLPVSRLAYNSRPFTHCGVDYFGPMFVKIGRRREKRWGVLFTCMVTRAVHIELANTLSASSTIMAVQRLAGRRGFPRHMYSDNGTNFLKASKDLRDSVETTNEKQQAFAESQRFTWSFNPPDAPHMGGAWERMVRSVKVALKTVLRQGDGALHEEVLHTLLVEIEHMVNSRPITHVSTDPNDEEALTPNHFLIGCSSGHVRLEKYEAETFSVRKNYENVQKLAKAFWRRWLREYLPTLLPRKKWHGPIVPLKVGDLVLIVDYQAPHNSWKKGRIVEVYKSSLDGIIRSAKVRAGKSFFVRPTHKLVLIFANDRVNN